MNTRNERQVSWTETQLTTSREVCIINQIMEKLNRLLSPPPSEKRNRLRAPSPLVYLRGLSESTLDAS